MKLRSTLFQIAALLSAATACSAGGPSTDTNGSGSDGGVPDGSAPRDGSTADVIQPGCGGCGCGSPTVPQGKATPEQACAILTPPGNANDACSTFCAALNGGGTKPYYCTVASDYQTAWQNAQTGTSSDPDAGNTCPAWTGGDVVVQCGYPCLGRRTEGIDDPAPCEDSAKGALGVVFANRAYLEAVSVHAFARLERELEHHGAPESLLRESRRARRDEVRHTAMTMRLARRFGAAPSAMPEAPNSERSPARSLFEMARENAVEGCVRETYGAVIGLLEANLSSDVDVRRASKSIAEDECRHAELAFAVARWIDPLLTADERAAVQHAAHEAIANLKAHGADDGVVDLLTSRIWEERLLPANRDHAASSRA